MSEPLEIVFLLGCTGCGKGEAGRLVARRLGAEIISVDSMKVYRGMDIGTAKPSVETRRAVPHHVIDAVDAYETYSVADFVRQAEEAAAEITARGRRVLAVGGTGLYIKALSEGLFEGPGANAEVRGALHARVSAEGAEALHGELCAVDPEAAARIHRHDERRIVRALEVYALTGRPITALQQQWDRGRTRHRCVYVGLRRSMEDQNRRTNARVRRLLELGWVEEVRRLLGDPRGWSQSARQALGYPELADHVAGRLSLADAVEKIKISTRQFAKSQRTWFKRFRETRWVDVSADESADAVADKVSAGVGA
ncbi:MAG: tRNA (adenosine(37)-N6)-dimethylallyltransferase MiaA [Phycisphaerales bacterium]|nr:tRNA (adenosine(37)-N6)-dimethylallyltransferase MiaA [Phycisphaerales bacterium]